MKRLFALLMALAMCLSLCACGGNSETPTENEGNHQPEAAQTTAPAEDNIVVQLGQEIDLGFVTMTFDSAALTYSVGGSGISTNAQDGMHMFSLTGKLMNTGGNPLPVGNVKAEMVFNGEFTYNAKATILDSKSYPVSVAPLAEAKYWIYAEIPEALLDRMATCEVRFSLNEDFATVPENVDGGDYAFRIQLDESVCQAALNPAPTEFFEESPALATPCEFLPCLPFFLLHLPLQWPGDRHQVLLLRCCRENRQH